MFDFAALHEYVRHDVDQYGHRLHDLFRHLDSVRHQQLDMGPVHGKAFDDEELLAKGGEAMLLYV